MSSIPLAHGHPTRFERAGRVEVQTFGLDPELLAKLVEVLTREFKEADGEKVDAAIAAGSAPHRVGDALGHPARLEVAGIRLKQSGARAQHPALEQAHHHR